MTGERFSEAMFERLAAEDPARLVALLGGDVLGPALLTFAAEIAGRGLAFDVAGAALLALLQHERPVVREGAVYGLRAHDERPEVAAALAKVAKDDPSPGVRASAGGVR
jgi:hypothetical protein